MSDIYSILVRAFQRKKSTQYIWNWLLWLWRLTSPKICRRPRGAAGPIPGSVCWPESQTSQDSSSPEDRMLETRKSPYFSSSPKAGKIPSYSREGQVFVLSQLIRWSPPILGRAIFITQFAYSNVDHIRNTLIGIPRTMFDQTSGHFLTQVKLTHKLY